MSKRNKKMGRPRKYEDTSKVYGISLTQGERDKLAKIHESLTESIKILISESIKAKDSAS